jgi:DNA excision repair protein ERCC-1
MAKATTEQLQNLPGFGQVKVKRMKDAFERPFRNNATTSLVFPAFEGPVHSASSKGKGKEVALRAPSPVWDIELDSDPATNEAALPDSTWEIELDLNESDG